MSTSAGALQMTYPCHKQNQQTELYQTDLTNNIQIETDQWLMTNWTHVLQPIPLRLHWPITFNGPDYYRSTKLFAVMRPVASHFATIWLFETILVCPCLITNRTLLERQSLLSLLFFKIQASKLGVWLIYRYGTYMNF